MTFKPHARALVLLAAAVALSVLGAQAQVPAKAPAPTSKANWPADVDRQSGFRLPLLKRDDLDQNGREAYDRGTTPGATTAGLHGPTGIQLYSTRTAPLHSALNTYFRREAGISPRIREIAIMTTAREFDSLFEWNAHEPEGLKNDVPPAVVDAIKHRKALDGLDPTDAIVVQFGARAMARPQGHVRDLCQSQGCFRAQAVGRSRHADGQLRQHGRTADRIRHADPGGRDAPVASALIGTGAAREGLTGCCRFNRGHGHSSPLHCA